MSDTITIGVDHGYAAMKTTHCAFPTISDPIAVHDVLLQFRFQRVIAGWVKVLVYLPAREFLIGTIPHVGEADEALVPIVRRVRQGVRVGQRRHV